MMARSQTDRASEDELRIALAMRGGVSLAVWIGGATAEIGQLCVAPPSDQSDRSEGSVISGFWSQLREAAGYGNVIIDVMSGASAGGLNAVIGAASFVYNFPLDSLRDVWLDLGDFDKLLRSAEGDMPANGFPSLMMGDEYFLAQLAERLHTLAGDPMTDPVPVPRVDVTVAGTLLHPIERERIRGDADTTDTRFTTTFRFRSARPVHTDFPTDPEGRRLAIERLAIAGRATSSFPVAFEAAEVWAPRPKSFESAYNRGDELMMTGVFGEATADGLPFNVMDGGVLDNIPIARAISAITDAPANRPTRRVLVYVQPGSAGTKVLPQAQKFPRSTAAVLEAMVKTRLQEETIDVDLRQLDAYNARARRVRSNAAAAVGSSPPIARYCSQRTAAETDAVLRLLDDPIATLGSDPFPMIPVLKPDPGDPPTSDDDPTQWLRTIDKLWRSPIKAGWKAADAEAVAQMLPDEIGRRLGERTHDRGDSFVTIGVGPLRRLAQLLLDAARAAHLSAPVNLNAKPGDTNPNDLKAALYRVLTVHCELVETPRSLAWTVMAVRGNRDADDVAAWIERTIDQVENITRTSDASSITAYLETHDHRDSGMTGTDTTGTGQLDAADAEMRVRLDHLLQGELNDDRGTEIRDVLWQRLCSIAEDLRRVPVDEVQLGERCEKRELGALVLRWLNDDRRDASAALADLEVATFDPTGGEIGATAVTFFRLSGANATPLAAAFPRLLGNLREKDPTDSIEHRLNRPAPLLTPKAKLAGNELMNFAAFLRRRWRANDWMWGRLDAVPTMVEIVLEPARLTALAKRVEASQGQDRVVPELMRRFQSIVCASGTNTTTPEWKRLLENTAWNPRCQKIEGLFEKARDQTSISESDMRPLREALVAARQWDIVVDLLPTVCDPASGNDTPPLRHDRTLPSIIALANEYAVGVESISNPVDNDDPKLIRKTVFAARSVLAQTSSSKAARTAYHIIGTLAGSLSWIWLNKTWPWFLRILLLAGGIACLTVPAYCLTHGERATRLASAAAGPAALAIIAGAVIYLARSQGAGLTLFLGGIGLGLWACWAGNLYALAVVLAPVGAVALMAGVVLHLVMRARPSL